MNIENESDANSYGDLEDFSPLIKKPKKNLSKKNTFSDKQLANQSNKNISSIEDEGDKNVKICSNQINSTTSIQKNIENIIVEENENMNSHSRDDLLFLNLIANQDSSKQIKNSSKPNTIANVLIKRSSKSKKSYFSQHIIQATNKFIEDRNSQNNQETINEKGISSLSVINNQLEKNQQTVNSQNSQSSQKSASMLNQDKSSSEITLSVSMQNVQEFQQKSLQEVITNEENEKDLDLINKILFRQENSNSVVLNIDDQQQQEEFQKELSQQEIFYSQTVINNE